MALIQTTFLSKTLMREVNVVALLPDTFQKAGMTFLDTYRPGAKFQTLYLYHGAMGNEWDWLRKTALGRYVENNMLAVIMPSAELSFYTDGTFFGEELVDATRFLFPLSRRRADTFVAGLSMGGYGALRTALNFPDRFSAAASISGALDVYGHYNQLKATPTPGMGPELYENAFGDMEGFRGGENDLFHMSARRAEEGKLPEIYQACGTEDFLYKGNIAFREHMKGLGAEHTYAEGSGGHEWAYWDAHIEKIIDWLPLKKAIIAE
ncbi:esterase family protein [Oscillospiraceae bacterium OttesenSCG-928-F05]|nr:esterase family protein [Oscillospiraceae bacterium OttesenSCG-928-F05]